MGFILMGFDHSDSMRRFVFECIGADRSRSTVIVSADLTLVRRYSIPVQSLPLVCRQILEGCDATTVAAGSVTLTEADVAAVSKAARDAGEQTKRRRSRPVASTNKGIAWRGPGNAMLAPKLQ